MPVYLISNDFALYCVNYIKLSNNLKRSNSKLSNNNPVSAAFWHILQYLKSGDSFCG